MHLIRFKPRAGNLVCFLVVLFGVIFPAAAQAPIPRLSGRVVDQAGMISGSAERQITQMLEDLERTDSTQIAVLTIASLEGESIEGFGIRVADAWQIGTAAQDNGAILIVSEADRKIRIEVGYGLEGSLTDLIAGRIVDNVISPAFKSGNFDEGFLNGVQAMTQVVSGEYEGTGSLPGEQSSSSTSSGGMIFWIVPFIIFAMISSGARGAGRGRRRGGSGALWFLLGMGAGSGHRRHHSSSSFGGGGGFGGFSGGGGGFGGGGASGGW